MIYISKKYANMMASLLMEYSWDVDTVSKLVIHRYIYRYTPNLWQCWWENIGWMWWWWRWRNSTSWWLLMNRDDGSWVSHANHLISLFGCDTDISLVSGFNLIEGVASLSNAWLFWVLKLSGVDAPRLAGGFFFHVLTWTKGKLTPQTLAIPSGELT